MAGTLQHLRSATLDKRPNPASMVDGQVAINYADGSPGLFFKDSNGDLVKVGPVHVGSTAPNATPAGGGTAGNSVGEQWLDTSGSTYVFKIWDGAAWRSEAGEFVNATGDTMTGALVLPSGTEGAPALGVGSADNGLYSPGTDQVAISTNGTEQLRITSDGKLGLGTTVEGQNNADNLTIADSGSCGITIRSASDNFGRIYFSDGISGDAEYRGIVQYDHVSDRLQFASNSLNAMTIDSSQRVGIGTTSPSETLTLNAATGASLGFEYGGSEVATISNNNAALYVTAGSGKLLSLGADGSEAARIDSSGRLLVGTSSARSNFFNTNVTAGLQVEGTGQGSIIAAIRNTNVDAEVPVFLLARSRGTTVGSSTVVQNNDHLGYLSFQGSDGAQFVEAAQIKAEVDGTPGADDMPGRLVFSVTADGASSPTEAMRIKNSGIINIANTPVYADNAAAKTGGLVDGDVYRTSTGDLKIVYT